MFTRAVLIFKMSKNKKYFSLYNRNLCHKFDKISVKNLPAVQETWVQSLGREDSLEEGLATHSGISAWRIPWTWKPGGLQFMGS